MEIVWRASILTDGGHLEQRAVGPRILDSAEPALLDVRPIPRSGTEEEAVIVARREREVGSRQMQLPLIRCDVDEARDGRRRSASHSSDHRDPDDVFAAAAHGWPPHEFITPERLERCGLEELEGLCEEGCWHAMSGND